METQIYKLPELKQISADQGYKLAALEDSQGKRIQPFNKPNVKLEKQFSIIRTRLGSNLFPDGIYYVCLSQNINRSGNPDRYPISKGKVSAEKIPARQNLSESNPVHAVLTYDSALKFQKEISDLQADKKALTAELAMVKAENELLKKQLDEPLEEGNDGMKQFLDEGLPQVMPIVDRWFDLEEKKIALEEKKMTLRDKINSNGSGKKQVHEVKAGSREHLALIETLYNGGNDAKLNTELDKLEEANYELYEKVCKELNIDLSEEEEEEGGTGE